MFDLSPTAMAVVARDGSVVDMNAAGLALTAHRSLDTVVGTRAYGRVKVGDRRRVLAAHEAAFAGGSAPAPVEYRLSYKSGNVRNLVSSWIAFPVVDGVPPTVLVVTNDITAQRQSEAALSESKTMLRTFVEINRANFWSVAPDGLLTFAGDLGGSERKAGVAITMEAEHAARPIHPDDVDRVNQLQQRCFSTGTPFDCEYRRLIDGNFRWAHARAFPRNDDAGRLVCWYGSTEDIDDRKSAELKLVDSEAFSRRMIEASADIIQLIDLDGMLTFTNERGLEAIGLESADTITGKGWATLWPVEARPLAEQALEKAKAVGVGKFVAVGVKHRDGDRWWSVVVSPVRDAGGTLTGLMAMSRDFTQHKLAEEHIRWMATHDPLTDLPNRRMFQESVESAMAEAATHDEKLYVILLDLDWFKEINDELGHDAGDAVLLAIASRLREFRSPVTVVSRLGGDEFALLVRGADEADAVQAIIAALSERLHDPVDWNGRMLACRGSFGIANYPDHGDKYVELLRHADTALYMAKALGRGGYACYVPAMQRAIERKAAVAARVRKSLASELIPYYQPKIRLADGSLDGFEALLRIKDEHGRVQGPGSIASAFDDSELACLMSERMLDQVTDDMRRWLDAGVEFGRIALNAGAAELRRGGFAERVLKRLAAIGIESTLLDIEVTESVFLGRDSDVIDVTLRDLCFAGVGIALDDFGTGYASLAHIKRYPVDTIKIDRSFISGIGKDSADEGIVRALLALGDSLDLTVVGEGIETDEQAAFLSAGGCAVGQGFLFSRALPAAKVPALISKLKVPRMRGRPLVRPAPRLRIVA